MSSSFFKSLSVFFLVAFVASLKVRATEEVRTPYGLTQCRPYNLTWTGGDAPYTLYVYPGCGADPDSDTPYLTVENITTKWAEWTVNLKVDTQVMLVLTDVNGADSYSDDVTIYNSTTTSCLNQTAIVVTHLQATTSKSATSTNTLSIGGGIPTTQSTSPTGSDAAIQNVAGTSTPSPTSGSTSGSSRTVSTEFAGFVAIALAMVMVGNC